MQVYVFQVDLKWILLFLFSDDSNFKGSKLNNSQWRSHVKKHIKMADFYGLYAVSHLALATLMFATIC